MERVERGEEGEKAEKSISILAKKRNSLLACSAGILRVLVGGRGGA